MEQKPQTILFITMLLVVICYLFAGSPETIVDENGNTTTIKNDPLREEDVPVTSVMFFGSLFMFIVVKSADAHCSYYSEKLKYVLPESLPNGKKLPNPPIPRCPDVFCKHGILWTYNGYNRGMTRTGNDLHVAPMNCVEIVGGTLIYKGEKKRISGPQFLDLLKLTGLPKNQVRSLYIEIVGNCKNIYTVIPLNEEAKKTLVSVDGKHIMGSDRFKESIEIMKDRLKTLEGATKEIESTRNQTLDNSKDTLVKVSHNRIAISDGKKEQTIKAPPREKDNDFN